MRDAWLKFVYNSFRYKVAKGTKWFARVWRSAKSRLKRENFLAIDRKPLRFGATESAILFHHEIHARAPRLINFHNFAKPRCCIASTALLPGLRAYFFTSLGVPPSPSSPHNFLASFLKRDFNPTVRASEISRIEEGGRDRPTTRLQRVYDDIFIDISILRSLRFKTYSFDSSMRKSRVFTFIGEYLRLLSLYALFLFGEEKKSKVKERKEYRQRVRCIEYFRCNLSPSPLPFPTINIQPTFECLKFILPLISMKWKYQIKTYLSR